LCSSLVWLGRRAPTRGHAKAFLNVNDIISLGAASRSVVLIEINAAVIASVCPRQNTRDYHSWRAAFDSHHARRPQARLPMAARVSAPSTPTWISAADHDKPRYSIAKSTRRADDSSARAGKFVACSYILECVLGLLARFLCNVPDVPTVTPELR